MLLSLWLLLCTSVPPVGAADAVVVPAVEGRAGLMVPVREVFSALGFAQSWDPQADTVTLTRERCAITLTIGKNTVSVRDPQAGTVRDTTLRDAPRYVRGQLYAPLTSLWDAAGLSYKAVSSTAAQVEYSIANTTVSAQLLTPQEEQVTQDTKGSVVKLETTRGDIVLELFDTVTPVSAGSFLELVARGFYDDLSFHRVIPAFMIQGGDPLGNGSGGPGFTIPDEAGKGLEHERGSLSMAKTAAPNTGGSQFFICHVPCGHLDGVHTVFGACIEGLEVVDAIKQGDRIRAATIIKKSPDADAAITAAEAARVPEK
jgi:peptidyl-prolyl cis-trans isomerase B (cyclophilin B)